MSTLQAIIDSSSDIVFFGGAGVSTESGIPDFRSVDGLYNQEYDYPPETILSRSFFCSNPEVFYKFCREKIFLTGKKPNGAHLKLTELERAGKLSAVITQNIDGLHTLAGSKNVLELHGTVSTFHCTHCKKSFSLQYVLEFPQNVPLCESCGAILKPDVVLYEEPLNNALMQAAVGFIHSADTLIIGGTSLVVNPAAGLINYFCGKNLVLINKQATIADERANLVIRDSIGRVMTEIVVRI